MKTGTKQGGEKKKRRRKEEAYLKGDVEMAGGGDGMGHGSCVFSDFRVLLRVQKQTKMKKMKEERRRRHNFNLVYNISISYSENIIIQINGFQFYLLAKIEIEMKLITEK